MSSEELLLNRSARYRERGAGEVAALGLSQPFNRSSSGRRGYDFGNLFALIEIPVGTVWVRHRY